MKLVDYHIHTELCEHASGTTDEYIEAAIDRGLNEIGFSDHAPLPPGLRDGITMTPDQTEKYISLIESKRDEYSGRIAVKVAFEVDFPLMDSFDRKYFADKRLDYMIGSCHFLGDWAFDHPANISEFDKRDINEVYRQYYEVISQLARSKYFNILGHIDLVKKFGHRPDCDLSGILERLSKILAENEISVEINTAGLRKPVEEIYPSSEILDILFRMNVPVTLGSDSHAPQEVGFEFEKAVKLARRAGYRKISGFSRRKRYDIAI